MTDPKAPATNDDAPADETPRQTTPPAHDDEHQPPHPPFARTPDEYTDPPGHHRRGPNGPALDVGA